MKKLTCALIFQISTVTIFFVGCNTLNKSSSLKKETPESNYLTQSPIKNEKSTNPQKCDDTINKTYISESWDDRSKLNPAQLIVGEWQATTKTYEPSFEFPNSREYLTAILEGKETGTRTIQHENGKMESITYSIVRENENSLECLFHLTYKDKQKVLFTFDKTGTKMVQRWYISDEFFIETHHLYVGPITNTPSESKGNSKNGGQLIMVRVSVWDDTQRKPVNTRAEIWFKEYGSWWFKQELEYGGTVKDLGLRPSGIPQTLFIYPDSRSGIELKVPYMMTDEMNPKGSPRDMISVYISDSEISVVGLPIEAATGKYELKYRR